MPLFLFSLLFGLSMDYQVFLLTRIKERFDHTGDTREAVAHGIGRTAGIITGAAAIMVCVFGGMATGELVMFQQMGFGLAVAIFLDATVVRTIIVPAGMELLGDWNWYLPRWLEWLPNISVEGRRPLVGGSEAPLARRSRRRPAGERAGAADRARARLQDAGSRGRPCGSLSTGPARAPESEARAGRKPDGSAAQLEGAVGLPQRPQHLRQAPGVTDPFLQA